MKVSKKKGFVCNCLISMRENESQIFYSNDMGQMMANLNGYAIIPLEEYEELTGDDMSDVLSEVKNLEFDED